MSVTARAALAGALIAGLLSPSTAVASSASPGGACSSAAGQGALETVLVQSLAVELRAARPRYAPGDTVRLRIAVTRPAGGDPAGLGVPLDAPAGAPAEGVEVGVGVSIGSLYLYGYGRTDAAGVTTVRVKLPSNTPSKPASVRALASKRHVSTICANVDEVGFAHVARLFSVGR